MSVNRLIIYLTLSQLLLSCVEPFEPELEESQYVLVISGMISDREGPQSLLISRSSPYDTPEFNGLAHCVVYVEDQDGHILVYQDMGGGSYQAYASESFLEVGDAVRIYVQAPNGAEYRSDYDTLLACPDLERIYWELDQKETADPEFNRPGIQFYLDMSGNESDSRSVLWRVDESWEYWASLLGNRILYRDMTVEEFYSRVLFRCWKSFPLDQLYLGNTRNMKENVIKRLPLHFVSNETDRLSVTYCLHVQQQSLSSAAYDYWRRMNEQAAESGGLHDSQPASVPGNLYRVGDAGDEVLGFFYASQVHEKRVFVHNNNLFEFYVPHIDCEYQSFSSIWQGGSPDFPVYFNMPGPFQPSLSGPQECFDCRLQGGDTIRPTYWESWP